MNKLSQAYIYSYANGNFDEIVKNQRMSATGEMSTSVTPQPVQTSTISEGVGTATVSTATATPTANKTDISAKTQTTGSPTRYGQPSFVAFDSVMREKVANMGNDEEAASNAIKKINSKFLIWGLVITAGIAALYKMA